MKWLCIDSPARLCTLSCSTLEPNGTLPMLRSKELAASRLAAKDSVRICACGYSAAATAAVLGSSSTPIS